MRDGRAGEVEGAGEVAHAHLTTGAGRDHRDQTQPYRVAVRLEPGGERCRLLGADRLFGERRAAGGVKQRQRSVSLQHDAILTDLKLECTLPLADSTFVKIG